MFSLKNFIIICGHYGCGKTNLSLNLALDFAKKGESVTLVDFDLVNPYFRSSDYQSMLQEAGVHVIAPTFANTNLDLPFLAPEIYSVFETKGRVILDVGGDDVGSTVLGRFYTQLKDIEYDMLYVINYYRNLITDPMDAVELLKEIETASRLTATGIINNSHLKWETGTETILDSGQYAREVSKFTGLPLIFTAVPRTIELPADLGFQKEKTGAVYPIDIHVRTSFEGEI